MYKKDEQKNKTRAYIVKEKMELMPFLQACYPEKSRNTIKSLLAHKQVRVNNIPVTQYNHLLQPNQEVTVFFGKVDTKGDDSGVRILFEDKCLIVIEKRAGLLSMATEKERDKTAYSYLSTHVKKEDPLNKVYILHRLDRETSGVMMFAKTMEVQAIMQRAWNVAVTERTYIAVVEGNVKDDAGTITSWLRENKNYEVYSSPVDNGGQLATTHYKVLKRNKLYTMVELKLDTGRKNQIRVHMQLLGNSVVGDKKYGANSNPIGRIGLHANVLTFRHPYSNKEIRYESFIPKSFTDLFSDVESAANTKVEPVELKKYIIKKPVEPKPVNKSNGFKGGFRRSK